MMMQWVRVIAILTAAVIAQDDPWNLKQVYWEEHRGKITKHTSPKAYDAHAVSKERVASISGKGINTGGHVRFGLSENNSNAVAEYHIALMPHGAFDDKNRHASWGTGDRFEVFVNSYGDVEAWQYRSDGTSKKFKTWSRNGKTGKLFAKVSPYEHKNGMSDLLLMETKDENDYKWDKKQVYWEKHRGKITKHTSPKAYDAHAVSQVFVGSISGKGITTSGHVRFGLSENDSNAVAEYHIALMPHGVFDDKSRRGSWGTGDRFEVALDNGNVSAWQYRSDGTTNKLKTWSRNGKTGGLYAKISPYEQYNGMSDVVLKEPHTCGEYLPSLLGGVDLLCGGNGLRVFNKKKYISQCRNVEDCETVCCCNIRDAGCCDKKWVPGQCVSTSSSRANNIGGCHAHMKIGEKCEADKTLPDGNTNFNIDNCFAYDIFEVQCK